MRNGIGSLLSISNLVSLSSLWYNTSTYPTNCTHHFLQNHFLGSPISAVPVGSACGFPLTMLREMIACASGGEYDPVPYGTGCCIFDVLCVFRYDGVTAQQTMAQLVARRAGGPEAVGSSPTSLTIQKTISFETACCIILRSGSEGCFFVHGVDALCAYFYTMPFLDIDFETAKRFDVTVTATCAFDSTTFAH